MAVVESKTMTNKHTTFDTTISGILPNSALKLSDEKKTDVLVALLVSLRDNIVSWNDRAYRAAVWSAGLLMSATGYCMVHSASQKNLISCHLTLE